MIFYQSVFHEKNFFKTIGKKGRFGVITLQYLPFLARALPPKIFFQSGLYRKRICGVAKKSKIL